MFRLAVWAAVLIATALVNCSAHSRNELKGQLFNFIEGFFPSKCHCGVIFLDAMMKHKSSEHYRTHCLLISSTGVQDATHHANLKSFLWERGRKTPRLCVGVPRKRIIQFARKECESGRSESSARAFRWSALNWQRSGINMNYRPDVDCGEIPEVPQADLNAHPRLIFSEHERAIDFDSFNIYPRPLSGLHNFELLADMMVSAFERSPLEKCGYSQSSSCDGQYTSPPNEGASQPNNRAFAYIVVGLSLITCAFFPAWGAIAFGVYWTDRQGWRLISASLLLVTIFLVYQGMTLIGLGADSAYPKFGGGS